jgi:hypothetical protein
MSADKKVITDDDILGMSDEDVMNMTAPPVASVAVDLAEPGADKTAAAVVQASADEEEDGDDSDEGTAGSDKKAGDTSDEEEDGEDAADAVVAAPATTRADADEPGEKKPAEVVKADAKEDTDKKPEVEAKPVDFEAEYKRMLAPFKANGRDVQVASVEDAINLMQMGANYNKKMAALKPNLKLLKLLENNGLLSEEKISFMIDLGKKDPGAINRLVKESGIDPMEIDADKASAYKQTTYAVDDREVELDTVLDELQGTQTYTRTLDVVSNKWDAASKQAISQEPQLLKVINDHMASGIYDQISTEIERERMFGRLNGVSDIAAYRQVGDAIQARGGFNHLFNKNTVQVHQAEPVIVQPKPKADVTALNDKRRAASPTKAAAPTTAPADFNPLALSDEEFGKLAAPRYR